MTRARTFMDIQQQCSPFFFRDVEELDHTLMPPVDVSVYQDIHLSLPGDPFRFSVVLWEDVVPYVPEQVHSPGRGYPLGCHDVMLSGGMVRPGF